MPDGGRSGGLWPSWVCLMLALTATACSSPAGQTCESSSDCQSGYECVATGGVVFGDKLCLLASHVPGDGGTDPGDADVDATSDVGPDTAQDTSVDTGDAADIAEDDAADADAGTETDTCAPDECGVDTDGDGILDSQDGCPTRANPNQRDRDGDGTQDACDDSLSADLADARFLGPAQGCCGGVFPWRVSGGADLTGDGRDDLIVSGHQYNEYVVWIIDGTTEPAGEVDPNSALARISLSQERSLGISLATPGDVNADGVDDLLIAHPGANTNGGRAYLFLGGSGLQGHLGSADAAGTYYENREEHVGFSVDIAQDLNGDGFDDMVISEPYGGGAGIENGRVHILFGRTEPPDRIQLSETTGADVRLLGADNERAGWSVAGVGDIDGDGLGDLVVGAPHASGGAGAVYVVFGDSGWSQSDVALADIGVTLKPPGGTGAGQFGAAVAAGGDVNGDGFDDFLIGAPAAATRGGHAEGGAAYVVFGGDDWSGRPSELIGTSVPVLERSIHLDGSEVEASVGATLAALGDLDGDGLDDFAVGAPLADDASGSTRDVGRVSIVYGASIRPIAVGSTLELVDYARSLYGHKREAMFGYGVSSAGDVDADGRPDLLVSAAGDLSGVAGGAFLFYGQ